MKKRVKMVDVARAAEVSRTTVSLILNDIPGVRIAEATRQRVLRTARDLGYTPGPFLSDLDPVGKRLVGVLINEVSAAYPVDILYGLQTFADAQALQLIVQMTDGLADREAAALDTLGRLGVEHVIYASAFTTPLRPAAALGRFRHVLLNCRREDGSGLAVLPAERHGGFVATRHLASLGRRRIATITGDPWQWASKERLAGYHRALTRDDLPRSDQFVRSTNWSHAAGFEAALTLLRLDAPPDAIFCHNDLVARGAIAAARSLGGRVPDDIAIIGYDDREFAQDLEISSITLPFADMAETALAALVSEETLEDRTISVEGRLLVRGSTVKVSG